MWMNSIKLFRIFLSFIILIQTKIAFSLSLPLSRISFISFRFSLIKRKSFEHAEHKVAKAHETTSIENRKFSRLTSHNRRINSHKLAMCEKWINKTKAPSSSNAKLLRACVCLRLYIDWRNFFIPFRKPVFCLCSWNEALCINILSGWLVKDELVEKEKFIHTWAMGENRKTHRRSQNL